MPDLPPLDSLRVFEAAARHLSFQAAAEELNITPSAVSHRMRKLEAFLGTGLFEKAGRGIVLTPQGEQLVGPVREALDGLRAATRLVSQRRANRPLTMTVAPGFAVRWLLPRLARFQRAHPDIEVRFDSTSRSIDLANSEFDLGIRFGTGEWPGLFAERLFAYDTVPVAAPSLIETGPPLEQPSDVGRYPRLHVAMRPDDWRMWLLAAHVDGVDPDEGPVFESLPVAMEAAIQGLGIVIAEEHIIRDEVAAGRLVRLFPEVDVPASGAYFLVYAEGSDRDRRIRAFRSWLLKEAERDDGPSPRPARRR